MLAVSSSCSVFFRQLQTASSRVWTTFTHTVEDTFSPSYKKLPTTSFNTSFTNFTKRAENFFKLLFSRSPSKPAVVHHPSFISKAVQEAKEKELETKAKALADRETAIANQEAQLAQQRMALEARERAVKEKETVVPESAPFVPPLPAAPPPPPPPPPPPMPGPPKKSGLPPGKGKAKGKKALPADNRGDFLTELTERLAGKSRGLKSVHKETEILAEGPDMALISEQRVKAIEKALREREAKLRAEHAASEATQALTEMNDLKSKLRLKRAHRVNANLSVSDQPVPVIRRPGKKPPASLITAKPPAIGQPASAAQSLVPLQTHGLLPDELNMEVNRLLQRFALNPATRAEYLLNDKIYRQIARDLHVQYQADRVLKERELQELNRVQLLVRQYREGKLGQSSPLRITEHGESVVEANDLPMVDEMFPHHSVAINPSSEGTLSPPPAIKAESSEFTEPIVTKPSVSQVEVEALGADDLPVPPKSTGSVPGAFYTPEEEAALEVASLPESKPQPQTVKMNNTGMPESTESTPSNWGSWSLWGKVTTLSDGMSRVASRVMSNAPPTCASSALSRPVRIK